MKIGASWTRGVVALVMVFSGCAKDTGGGSKTRPPVDPPPAPPVDDGGTIGTFDVDLDSVGESGGCLSLPKLYQHIRDLRTSVRVRAVTTNFEVLPREGAAAPRPNLINYLALASFQFSESKTFEFASTLPWAQQQGCEKVVFESGEAGRGEFKITEYSDMSLTISDGSSEQRIRITGPRTVEIVRSYQILDVCTDYETLKVRRSEAILWDEPRDLEPKPTEMSGKYLRTLSLALKEVPPSIQEVISGEVGDGVVSLSRSNVMDLVGAEASVAAKQCKPPKPEPDVGAPPTTEQPPAS